MAETYCGKTCEVCTYKTDLNCPGCRVGPGRAFAADCEIARCSRGKGHEHCGTCSMHGNCGKLRSRQGMAESRVRKIRLEAEQNARLAQRIPLLAKWLRILFWLTIGSIVVSLVLNDQMAEAFPVLRIPSVIVSLIFGAAYSLILLKLSFASDRYRMAGICGIVSMIFAWIPDLLPEVSWSWILTWLSVIPGFIAEFQEYQAHADTLENIDSALEEKWRKLWYWYIGSLIVVAFSAVLVGFAALLGTLVVVAALIALVAVEVLKIVYLYRTAKAFMDYPVEEIVNGT